MANLQLGTTESDVLTFDFLKADNTVFTPTQPYVFVSSDPAVIVGANIGNNKVHLTGGTSPAAAVVVSVTSPELPGQAAGVLVDVVSNVASGPVATTPPVAATFAAHLG